MSDCVPLFSVIIPVHNRERLILRAIRSVRTQTFPDYEIVVVDDCSTDGTPAVIHEAAGPDLRVVELPVNQGVSAARNAGAAEARGPYLIFLDSDDELLPGVLSAYEEHIRKWPDVELFWSGFRRIWEDDAGKVIGPKDRLISANSYIAGRENRLFPVKLGSCCALALASEAYWRLGGFDESFRVREDHEFFIRALVAKLKYASLDEIGLLKHLHQGQSLTGGWSSPQALESMIAGQQALIDKHDAFLRLTENRIMCLRLYKESIKWCYQVGKARNARSLVRRFFASHGWMWPIFAISLKSELRRLMSR